MQLRNRSGEPSSEQKAISNESATLDKYRREITDAINHWQQEEERARKTGSKALLSMSSTILGELKEKDTWKRTGRQLEQAGNRFNHELARRRVLSALGISMLLRTEWETLPAAIPIEIGPEGEMGALIDIVVDMRAVPEERAESRVHTQIAAPHALPGDASAQWYKEGSLWVRQVRPAEPTGYLVDEFLPSFGVSPDFAQFETVYPYVAAK